MTFNRLKPFELLQQYQGIIYDLGQKCALQSKNLRSIESRINTCKQRLEEISNRNASTTAYTIDKQLITRVLLKNEAAYPRATEKLNKAREVQQLWVKEFSHFSQTGKVGALLSAQLSPYKSRRPISNKKRKRIVIDLTQEKKPKKKRRPTLLNISPQSPQKKSLPHGKNLASLTQDSVSLTRIQIKFTNVKKSFTI